MQEKSVGVAFLSAQRTSHLIIGSQKKRAREGPVSFSRQACQEDRYEDRVSPRRSASRY